MSVTTLIEFDDITEHTFDAIKLTLLNDKGQLKSLVSANEILFSNFDGNVLPTLPEVSKRGGKTIVFSGTANTGQILGGVLNFPNADASIATYSNILDIVDDFALRCKVHMNVLTFTIDRDILVLDSNIDNSRIRFYLMNQGGGVTRIKREIRDASGAITDDLVLGTRDFSINPDFNVAFSNDDDGNTLTFLDGVLISTIASPTFNFTDCDLVLSNNAQASSDYDNLQLFKSNEITTAFAFPFPEQTTFDLFENIMITNIPFLVNVVVDFDIVEQIPADSQLKHFIILDGNNLYHDGTSWVVSNRTLAQANIKQEIKDNVATLPIVAGIGSVFQIGHTFKSDLGYATSLIESITMKYKFAFKADEVVKCLVFGTVVDNSGVPVVGATVRVNSSDKFFNNNFVGPSAKTITDSQGKFSISIVETASSNTTVDIDIEYTQKKFENGAEFDDLIVFPYKSRVIPALPTCEISDLATA